MLPPLLQRRRLRLPLLLGQLPAVPLLPHPLQLLLHLLHRQVQRMRQQRRLQQPLQLRLLLLLLAQLCGSPSASRRKLQWVQAVPHPRRRQLRQTVRRPPLLPLLPLRLHLLLPLGRLRRLPLYLHLRLWLRLRLLLLLRLLMRKRRRRLLQLQLQLCLQRLLLLQLFLCQRSLRKAVLRHLWLQPLMQQLQRPLLQAVPAQQPPLLLLQRPLPWHLPRLSPASLLRHQQALPLPLPQQLPSRRPSRSRRLPRCPP